VGDGAGRHATRSGLNEQTEDLEAALLSQGPESLDSME
jgi:hypothetical protein